MRENTLAWRLREQLKYRAPSPALNAYRRWMAPRIKNQPGHFQFSAWARTGRQLRDEFGTPRISFDSDGIWITDADGLEWNYEPDSWQSALGKELGWEHDKAELEHVIAALKPGDTYVDIGAHAGGFAIPIAKAHAEVTIEAFEPVPETRTWLTKNLARNGVSDRVNIWTCALGAEAHRGRMTAIDGMTNHLAETGPAGAGGVDVEVLTLDDALFDRVDRVDLIKCDVEGGEFAAMRGAERILRRDHPDLVIEIDRRFTPRYGYQPEDLLDYLVGLGYSWQWFAPDGLRESTDLDEALSQTNNFLFTRR